MYSLWSFYVKKNNHTVYLELDDTTEIAYEWLSPMWCRETSATWDFTLPRTPHNAETLLPAFPNGELYPLNEGHLSAYITGLPWQEEEEAYWGLLTVVATTERRIRVQFQQKSLFEQALDKPAKKIGISWSNAYKIAARESVRASGNEWKNNSYQQFLIAFEITHLLDGFRRSLKYDGTVKTTALASPIYLLPNRLTRYSLPIKIDVFIKSFWLQNQSLTSTRGVNLVGIQGVPGFTSATVNLETETYALTLVRKITALCCMSMQVTEYVDGSKKSKKVDFANNNQTNSRKIYLGDLSAYEWVKAYYPEIPDVAVKAPRTYNDKSRNLLIPILAYEENGGDERREYSPDSYYVAGYNDIGDGAPFGYRGRAVGREYYVPFNTYSRYFLYFQKPESDYETGIYMPALNHLGDCRPKPCSVSTSQYGVNPERETWVYEGEATIAVPVVKGRGAQSVAVSFERRQFVATNLRKQKVTTHGDTLLNNCKRVFLTSSPQIIFYHKDGSGHPQLFLKALKELKNNRPIIPYTAFAKGLEYLLDKWLKGVHHNNDHPSNPDEHDGLPLPPNWKRGGGGGNGKGGRHNFSTPDETTRRAITTRSVRGVNEDNAEPSPRSESYTHLSFKQDYFHAIGELLINELPPQPTLAVDPYDPTKPRADKLFLVGLQTVFNQNINIHPAARGYGVRIDKRPGKADGYYNGEYFTNSIRIADTVKRYFRHLWHAVEGNLSAWDEAEVFAAMTEYTYPADGDTNHIRNQRVKKVSLTLRRGECRIRAVRVIQFNHEASDSEWEAMLKG